MSYNSFGMLISTLNRDAVLREHKEGFDMYYEKAKRYFPLRHKDAEYRWLAKRVVSQARHYRDMIKQCQYVFETFGDVEGFY